MSNEDVVIVSAYRTPIGSFNGSLSSLKASDLGALVLKQILTETNTTPEEVILGQALTAGQGQNPARQTAINGGCPQSTAATTINMLCGSGLKACALGYQAIRCGDVRVAVCGGQESMSKAPHCIHLRSGGGRMGDATMTDTMMYDGLTDAFNNCTMGVTAEQVASVYNVSREEQDKFALSSQLKYAAAKQNDHFRKEIVPVRVVTGREEKTITDDEFPKLSSTLDGLKKLRACFKTPDGTVTPGNASGINDGAAMVMMTTLAEAKARNLTPLVRVVSWAQHGGEPMLMGVAPIEAVRKAAAKANWTLDQIDVFELNEAFASQSVAILKELKIDESKVNVNGGSIALGHPIGCSGARVLVTLIHTLLRTNKKRGLVALCIGGGMAVAMCVETI